MTTEDDELFLDPRAIAKQFISEAVENLRIAQHQANAEYLAEEERVARLCDRQRRSENGKRGWMRRKVRLAGATAPVDALADFD